MTAWALFLSIHGASPFVIVCSGTNSEHISSKIFHIYNFGLFLGSFYVKNLLIIEELKRVCPKSSNLNSFSINNANTDHLFFFWRKKSCVSKDGFHHEINITPPRKGSKFPQGVSVKADKTFLSHFSRRWTEVHIAVNPKCQCGHAYPPFQVKPTWKLGRPFAKPSLPSSSLP